MRFLPVLLSLLFLPHAVAFPASGPGKTSVAPILVTGVKVIPPEPGRTGDKTTAELTFNNSLKIREIGLSEAGGRRILKFPEYVSKNKRAYPQAFLLTRQALDAARRAVESERPDEHDEPAPLSYSIASITPYRKPSNLKAFASVVFNGSLQVECRIIDGASGPWVAWPARKPRGGGRWIQQVVFVDMDLKRHIEKDLIARYISMTEEDGTGTE